MSDYDDMSAAVDRIHRAQKDDKEFDERIKRDKLEAEADELMKKADKVIQNSIEADPADPARSVRE